MNELVPMVSGQLPDKVVVLHRRKFHENGFVVYKGPSHINGDDIVAILTLHSQNRKIGDMAQLWILPAHVSPLEAVETGEDQSICGECQLRHYKGGACYVYVGQEPRAVWDAWKNCSYPNLPLKHFDQLAGLSIRLGAYGDPVAVPIQILNELYKFSANHTAYTHQWQYPEFAALKQLCMASVDSAEEYHEAVGQNWRTYRVMAPGEELQLGEIWCPHPETGVQCKDCNLCSGSLLKAKNIAIPVHGSRRKYFNNVSSGANRKTQEGQQGSSGQRIISSQQLVAMEFTEYPFSGKWKHFIGNPSTNFNCVIHGLPGNGKSTFSIQFTKYLADNFGRVIYIAAEEKFSKTTKDKFLDQHAVSDNIHIADYKNADEIMGLMPRNTFDFIFIDSLDVMRIGPEKLRALKAIHPNAAFITVSQSTKTGQMRGSQEIQHEADIVVKLEGGTAATQKNRFNMIDQMLVVFTDEPE